jgi:hypothetical protein
MQDYNLKQMLFPQSKHTVNDWEDFDTEDRF